MPGGGWPRADRVFSKVGRNVVTVGTLAGACMREV